MKFDKKIYEKEKELLRICEKYNRKYRYLYSKAEKSVVRKEYSKGGQMMHRGYYCPSLVHDIICGNVNRGKLYKGAKHPSKVDFEYWYNNKGKLIAARSYADNLKIWQTEFIFYKENVSTSIFFDSSNNDIELVTMCKYKDDLLIEYDYMLIGGVDEKKDWNELNIEKYDYAGKMLRSCDTEIYLFHAGLSFKDHYDFEIRNHKLVCKDNM